MHSNQTHFQSNSINLCAYEENYQEIYESSYPIAFIFYDEDELDFDFAEEIDDMTVPLLPGNIS